MQAQVHLLSTTRQKLITAAVVAFLAVMAMVPGAYATSIVPEEESATGEAAARSGVSNPVLSRDQIQFFEDNWYLYTDAPDAGDNLAAVEPGTDDQAGELRPQNVEEFEAMERAPGLYTESPDAGSPARDGSVDAGLAHDEMEFLEDNWYLFIDTPNGGDNPAAIEPDTDDQADEHRPQNVEEFEAMERAPDLYTEAPDAGSPAGDDSVDAGLTHREMQFLEDNWYLSPDVAIVEDEDDAGAAAGNPSQTREEIQFNEDNWNFDSGEPISEDDAAESGPASLDGNNVDRADALAELQNGAGEVVDDRSHDELTYPWGGFLEHDY